MKNISNDAICTSANGRDIITEIREPLGSGIDHAREAVAILAFLSASVYTRTLLRHILLTQSHFRPAMWTRRKCRVSRRPCTTSLRSDIAAVKGTEGQLYQFGCLLEQIG